MVCSSDARSSFIKCCYKSWGCGASYSNLLCSEQPRSRDRAGGGGAASEQRPRSYPALPHRSCLSPCPKPLDPPRTNRDHDVLWLQRRLRGFLLPLQQRLPSRGQSLLLPLSGRLLLQHGLPRQCAGKAVVSCRRGVRGSGLPANEMLPALGRTLKEGVWGAHSLGAGLQTLPGSPGLVAGLMHTCHSRNRFPFPAPGSFCASSAPRPGSDISRDLCVPGRNSPTGAQPVRGRWSKSHDPSPLTAPSSEQGGVGWGEHEAGGCVRQFH